MTPETSIIIRTKNEERLLGTVLKKLFSQTYKNFEVVIVDSGSNDETLAIAKKFPVNIVSIPPEKFSYPYACNYGVTHSNGEKYIVFLSGHSVPVTNTWLADGIQNFEKQENICGVYSFILPPPQCTFWDKFFMNLYTAVLFLRGKYSNQVQNKWTKGVLGFTAAIVRKDLWEKRGANEKYGAGGEDEEWADYWMKKGFIVVRDKKFNIYHSHDLGFFAWIKQLIEWKKMSKKARTFKTLHYRTPD